MDNTHEYIVTLRHDGGRISIRTAATSPEVAVTIVLRAEKAPRRAVLHVRKVVPRHYVLRGRYGGRWEDLTGEATRSEILARLDDYRRRNEGGEYKIVTRTWEHVPF